MSKYDTLIMLVALAYFKNEFDIEEKLEEISETDWEILQTWEDSQDVSYGEILQNLLWKVKDKINELKGIKK